MSKEKLDKFIADHGLKHWSFAARKNNDFVAWVNDQTKDYPEESTFAERVYGATSGDHIVCKNGKKKKLISLVKRWRLCGTGGSCKCTAEIISEKSKAMHDNKTDQDYANREAKTIATNLERYGVTNGGQTEKALSAHNAFYNDPEKVSEAVAKVKETTMGKYGVESAFNLDHVRDKGAEILRNDEHRQRKREQQTKIVADGVLIRASYDKLKTKFAATGLTWNLQKEDYKGIYGDSGRDKYPFTCNVCGHQFEAGIYDKRYQPKCEICHPPKPYTKSKEEQSVADFLDQLGLKILRSKKNILPNGKEIDIYLPDHNLAIEYCGLRYHSELASIENNKDRPMKIFKDEHYHVYKMRECLKKGIRLITMFTDEWMGDRRWLSEHVLKCILGIPDVQIHESETICMKIGQNDANAFLSNYHLEGSGRPSENRYGLFNDDELIAVMTVGNQRDTNGLSIDGKYVIHRYASSVHIVDGEMRLFSEFIADIDPLTVETYCDMRWGYSDVYGSLGFVLDSVSDSRWSERTVLATVGVHSLGILVFGLVPLRRSLVDWNDFEQARLSGRFLDLCLSLVVDLHLNHVECFLEGHEIFGARIDAIIVSSTIGDDVSLLTFRPFMVTDDISVRIVCCNVIGDLPATVLHPCEVDGSRTFVEKSIVERFVQCLTFTVLDDGEPELWLQLFEGR